MAFAGIIYWRVFLNGEYSKIFYQCGSSRFSKPQIIAVTANPENRLA
jgi:hypothetical protein